MYNPFYYEFTPDENYYNPTNLAKKPIYNTADELDKYSTLERAFDGRSTYNRSPINTAHSRIYQPHDIYNTINSSRSRSRLTVARPELNKSSGTLYTNTENIIYIPKDTSPSAYYKNHKSLMDSLSKDNIFVYDDQQIVRKTQRSADNILLPSNVIVNSNYHNQTRSSFRSVKSLARDDDEIVYVPMKKSEFLQKGIHGVSLIGENNSVKKQITSSNQEIVEKQRDFIVLKEKTIKKDSLVDANLSKNENNNNSNKNNEVKKQERQQQAIKLKGTEPQQSLSIPIKIEIEPAKPSVPSTVNRNNFHLDPFIQKRYQLTPTENKSTDKVINQQIQTENHSITLNGKGYNNIVQQEKLKNPITGLFDFSKRKLIPRIY